MGLGSQEKRVWAKALLTKCPFDLELDNCPLRKVRKLPLSNRMALVNDMSDEEIDSVVQHHKDCQKERLLHETPKGNKIGRIKRLWR